MKDCNPCDLLLTDNNGIDKIARPVLESDALKDLCKICSSNLFLVEKFNYLSVVSVPI